LEKGSRRVYARGVYEDVDAAESLKDGVAQALDIGALAGVALEACGRVARGRDRLGTSLGVLERAAGDGDRRASSSEAFRHRAGEDAASANYDRDFAVETKKSISVLLHRLHSSRVTRIVRQSNKL